MRAPAAAPAEEARSLAALRPVLRDPDATGPDPAYRMYRGAGVPAQLEVPGRLGLRFDLTVLRAGRIGHEPVKTFGHAHPPAPGGDVSYPELYQVLHGQAWILLQRQQGEMTELFAIPAGPGDLVLIPPGFAHATVNGGDGPLVLANWVCGSFASDYEGVRARRGMAFYRLADRWEPNPRYPRPVLYRAAPTPAGLLGLKPGEPVYAWGVRQPERLGFLSRPAEQPEPWREAVRWLEATARREA